MRIFYTSGQDPVLLDSLAGMNALHDRLAVFIGSRKHALQVEAQQWGSAEPYDELLGGLRLTKIGSSEVNLALTTDRWLVLTGSVENLSKYVRYFKFEEDDDRHHPEYGDYMAEGTLRLILKVDTGQMERISRQRH